MSTSVDVLADSISSSGVRLTTLLCTFPRFILAEVNTHRMFSRSSASSRAIPPEKQIQRVIEEPFIPVFGSRVTGMGEGHLEQAAQSRARTHWIAARDDAVRQAKALLVLGADKSHINRLLEPFMYHTAIISATEWGNFFALRDNDAAQGEFRILARMMRGVMNTSRPHPFISGEWHVPLVDIEAEGLSIEVAKKVSVARCARVSYEKQRQQEPIERSLERHDTLLMSGHMSPFEHVATPANDPGAFYGNYRGWLQYRKDIAGEHDFSLMMELGDRVLSPAQT